HQQLDSGIKIDERYAFSCAVDFYPGNSENAVRAYQSHLTLTLQNEDPQLYSQILLDGADYETAQAIFDTEPTRKGRKVTATGRDDGFYFYPDTLTIDSMTYEIGMGGGGTDVVNGYAFEKPFRSTLPYQLDRLYYDTILACEYPIKPNQGMRFPPSLKHLTFAESTATAWGEVYGVNIRIFVHLAAEPLKTAFFEHIIDLVQLAVLCAVLGLAFFCVVRRLIVRPIRETADAAQAMSAEKLYGFPYDSERGDEIGQLNSALHDMSYRLRGQWEAERELERQRQEFLAAASHDLKTPLALIGGSAEAIAQEIDPDENARYLATIERECARMNGMIAQMLDASRTSQMKYLEKTAPFELPVLVERLLLDRAVLFGARPIEKHTPSSLSYCGDRAALGRAIGAILDNSAQYSAADARVTVTLTDLQPGFRLTVENEGAPIPERDLPHLFELFYRADHARDRKGSGIGLAVAARIFELHGLKYHAENVPNGVRFTIETPL
ncbi:MAG: HAMP domain-containing histidine kinase, partial [Butyricicoccus sp.]|nr:HAMP domain-containing histidine kinase [Butyricicoccus sp.]